MHILYFYMVKGFVSLSRLFAKENNRICEQSGRLLLGTSKEIQDDNESITPTSHGDSQTELCCQTWFRLLSFFNCGQGSRISQPTESLPLQSRGDVFIAGRALITHFLRNRKAVSRNFCWTAGPFISDLWEAKKVAIALHLHRLSD